MSETTLDISEARKQFNSLDERLSSENVITVTRHGKGAFFVVNLEYFSAMLETIEIMSDPESLQAFLESLEDIKEGRLHNQDDVVNELG